MTKLDQAVLFILAICIVIFSIGIVGKSLTANESNHSCNDGNSGGDNRLIHNTENQQNKG